MACSRTARRIPAKASATLLLALAFLAASPAHPQAQDLFYTPINIGPWSGPRFTDHAPLNDAGFTAGRGATQAYRWVNGASQDLGLLPQGTFSNPFGMNDHGQVVGVASVNNEPNDTRAFLWANGVMLDLGIESPGGTSNAAAINEAGIVVGAATVDTPTGQSQHAFTWINGQSEDLGTLPMGTSSGGGSAAYSINDASVVVGQSTVAMPGDVVEAHAFRLENGVMTDLGTLAGGTASSALDVNNLGQVVGWSNAADGFVHAVLWDESGIHDLGGLGGGESVAESINDLGQIVGYSSAGASFYAFLYQNTVMNRLDDLIDRTGFFSLTITRATEINNRGDIVALGSTGSRRTILLRKLCRDTDGNGNPDNDGDALCDNWETAGIDVDGDGGIDLRLYDMNQDGVVSPAEQADPNHKDVYVEIDWIAGHDPLLPALARVIDSFAQAPVTNPDGQGGVRLHLLVGEQTIAHVDEVAFASDPQGPTTPHFDEIKGDFFGTALERSAPNATKRLSAKRLAFRYSLFVHNRPSTTSSGRSELPGNDFEISLGSWAVVFGHGRGDVEEQAATFMHEFGHSLNLRHGGGDNFNCKPNYLSIMSYSRQIEADPVVGRPLDYSATALLTLDEGALVEAAGIGGPLGAFTAFGPNPFLVAPAGGAIDWNRNGLAIDAGVARNLNQLTGFGCNGAGSVLVGHDDWSNLQYDFRSSSDFADGVHATVVADEEELTREEALELSPDTDADGVTNLLDNCVVTPNAAQGDYDGDAVGNACDNCRVVANPGQEDANHDGVGDACPLPADADADGIADTADNCILRANGPALPDAGGNSQIDTDGDGYGNVCDGDINNSNLVTATDFGLLRTCINQPASASARCAAADMNGSGLVTSGDFTLLRTGINAPPGPSAVAP